MAIELVQGDITRGTLNDYDRVMDSVLPRL